VVARASKITSRGNLERHFVWCGLHAGDPVVIDLDKERRHTFRFVAFVKNVATGDEWVEVRGGRTGEFKDRSFRPELIFPSSARRGTRLSGAALLDAPQLPL
jgi:hypothetical protein